MGIVKEIGRGTSGVVYKVQTDSDGSFKVVKTIDMSSLSMGKQLQVEKEVLILKRVDHPHIIKYFNSVTENGVVYILMELASGGDLQTLISQAKQKRHYISENQIWAWIYELCLAVNYLHSHKILHRDIKCLNILLDSKNRIKLGDLGLSDVIQDQFNEKGAIGTPLFMSPEQIRRQPYGFKADIWAIGCVIYSLCSLDSPFLGDNLLTLGHNITNMTPKPLPPRYSPGLQTLVNMMLEKDQNLRPKIKDAIKLIPNSIKMRYKKPQDPIVISKTEVLPVIHPPKIVHINYENQYSLTISSRKFKVSDTPELPRSISRTLNKSRSRTTVNDLYNVV